MDLSPWLGGGFGMFATIESRGEHHVVALLETPGLTRPLAHPEELEELERHVRAFPTVARLQTLAERWMDHENARYEMGGKLRLELWQIRRDPVTLRPREVLLREAYAVR